MAERGTEKISTSTGEDGAYEFNLPADDWKVTVELFGFAAATQTLHPGRSAPPIEWTLALRPAPASGCQGRRVHGGNGGAVGPTTAGGVRLSAYSG